jgi:hypothetical protein
MHKDVHHHTQNKHTWKIHMISQINELAARILIEGWYKHHLGPDESPESIQECVNQHFPPKPFDRFDLDYATLTYKQDGWYLKDMDNTPKYVLLHREAL